MAPVHPSRHEDQPYLANRQQDWAARLIEAQHEEALYAFGELCLFTLMWRPSDFAEGRVDRCPTCFGGVKARAAAAFDQPTKKECPDCYGTTFRGGFRAQIIRPSLWADRNSETSDEARGTVVRETLRMETTGDFSLNKDDYVFRADGTRYQAEAKIEDVVRSGFGMPQATRSVAGSTSVHREEETSVAFRLPPTDAIALRALIGHPGPFLIEDLTASDILNPGGYL